MPAAERSRPRGRPRCTDCQASILEATVELLDEQKYSEVTIESIARRAGVSKQTIYKWWTSKPKLAMQACLARSQSSFRVPDTGNAEQDLLAWLGEMFSILRKGNSRATWASLIAETQSDPELAKEFRDTYIAARRKVGAELIERGIERGELRADTDVQVVLDLLYGPVWYRMLLRNGPLDAVFARHIVAHLMPAIRRGKAS